MTSSEHDASIDWAACFHELHTTCRNDILRDFYAAGAVGPDTNVSNVPFVAVDFETTGFDCSKDDIVSIGLVPFDTQRIYCGKARHWILKPARHLSESSIVIHQITHSDIVDAPDLSQILDELIPAITGRVVVVHYRQIERPFFSHALEQRIGEGICFPLVDTMEIERRVCSEQRSLIKKLLGKKTSSSLRLPDCRRRYHLPDYQLHHATTDAVATAELFLAQLAHHYRANVTVGELWC